MEFSLKKIYRGIRYRKKMFLFKHKPIRFIHLFLFTLILFLGGGFYRFSEAQIPREISVSLYLLNTENEEVTNGEYTIRFALYTKDRQERDNYPSNSDAGNRVWEETQTVIADNGVISVLLGSDTPLPAGLTFNDGTYYLGIRVNNDAEITPRKKLGSVPTAINSNYLNGKKIGTEEGDVLILGKGGKVSASQLVPITKAGTISEGTWEGDVITNNFLAKSFTNKTYNGLSLSTTSSGFSIQGGPSTLLISADTAINQNLLTTSSPQFSGLGLATSSAPTTPTTGAIYSDGTNLYYFNGSSWDDLTSQGISTFLGLSDTPDAYANAGYLLRTKNDLTGLEFINPSDIIISDHGNLNALSLLDDDHTQYALLSGRNGGQTFIGGTQTTDSLIFQTTSGIGTTGADMRFRVGNNGATEAMTILNSGRVGIGTSNPGRALDISATDQFGIQYYNSSGGPAEFKGLTLAGNYGSFGVWGSDNSQGLAEKGLFASSQGMVIMTNGETGEGGSGAIEFRAGGYRSANRIMKVDYTGVIIGKGIAGGSAISNGLLVEGSVGIGDTTPDQLLEILSSGAANTQLSIGNTNAGDYDSQIGFELADGTNTFTLGIDDSDSDKFKISTTGLGTNDRLVIDSSGNVGIGTSSPAQRLEVSGDIMINSLTIGRGGGNVGSNTASGYQALLSNTDGGGNIANGYQALYSNTTGLVNTANGYQALYFNTTGNQNTANGAYALYSNTTGSWNTANGPFALYLNTTGNYNTANGYAALYSNTTGNYNAANGAYALYSNTTGEWNAANGVSALRFNTTGNENTANGGSALRLNTTGNYNTANGYAALYSNTTGHSNTANGHSALRSNTTGSWNTATGIGALYSNTTGSDNTANGYLVLYLNTTGYKNTATGQYALYSNTTGYENVASGNASLFSNTTGFYNTVSGRYALFSNTSGSENTALGYQSGYSVSTGVRNILIGANAGYTGTALTTGSNNIIIGYGAGATATGMSNGLNIGNLIYGTGLDGTGSTLSSGNVGIGDTTPDQLLEILSSGAANTQLSIGNTNAGDYDSQIGFELADGTNTFTLGIDDSDSDKFKISTTGLGTNDRLTIDSSGIVTVGNQLNASADGLVTKVNTGACDDTTFTTDTNGTLCVDSSNGRIYFRYGDAWHYTAQTAGFQIPKNEVYSYNFLNNAFDTEKPLLTGDFLIPFVETSMEDGALHGLYARFEDIKDQLLPELESLEEIASLQERIEHIEEQLSLFGTPNASNVSGTETDKTNPINSSNQAIPTFSLAESPEYQLLSEQVQVLTDFYTALNLDAVPFLIDNTLTLEDGLIKTKVVEADTVNAQEVNSEKVTADQYVVINDDKAPTIGTVLVPKGIQEVVVHTLVVEAKSKILATPNIPVGVGIQFTESLDGFTVRLERVMEEDVLVNWWIVQEQ